MTVRIETDAYGKEILWSEVGGKAVPLPVENILIRAHDGHIFVAVPGLRGMEPLRPHEPEMIAHWMNEHPDGIKPVVFAGVSPPAKPEAEEDEPAPDG